MSIRIIISAFTIVLLFTSCGIKSNLTVPAKQQFVLGGEQKGAFKVKYENTGDETVTLKEISDTGKEIQSLKVEPGENGTVNFQKSSKALVINEQGQKARLKVKITGDTNKLGMKYTDVD
ncbi:MAG: hypothetical protein AAFY71_05770 [Bacteroidota bacterium]